MMEDISTAVLGLIVIFIMYRLAFLKSNYWKNRGLPHLEANIFFGNSLDIILMKKSIHQHTVDLYNKLKGKYKYAGYMDVQEPAIMIMDLELAGNILMKDFSSFRDHVLKRDPIFDNLYAKYFVNGNTWRNLRRNKLGTVFTSNKRKMMFNEMQECSDQIIDYMEAENKPFEARKLSTMFAINVLGSVAFNLKFNSHVENNDGKSMFDLSIKFFQPSVVKVLKLMFRNNFPKLFAMLNMQTVEDEISSLYLDLVKGIKKNRESGIKTADYVQLICNLIEDESSPTYVKEKILVNNEVFKKLDVSPVIDDESYFDPFLASHMCQTMSTGGDTLGHVLSCTIFEIARHPHVMRKLRDEVEGAFDENGFSYETVSSLRYMDQVLNEVMRMHPTYESLKRICTRDYEIPGSDHIIKKGDYVAIPISGFNRDPDYWNEPETFNPDRFEKMESLIKGSFLPFGSGPRDCIGLHLSMLIMKVFISRLVHRCNLKVSSKTRVPLEYVPSSLTNHNVGGIWIELEERNRNYIDSP